MRIKSNGTTLECEDLGNPDGPAIVLIQGQGAQLIDWPDQLIDLLCGAGYRVIVFDNRDIGLSDRIVPTVAGAPIGQRDNSYSIGDMADDTVGLMAALNLQQAHVLGSSMGGLIAQDIASRFPDLVTSLTLIMTSQDAPNRDQLLQLQQQPQTLEEFIASRMSYCREFGGSAYAMTDTEIREQATRHYQRAFDPVGANRQLATTWRRVTHENSARYKALPTLVIHGDDDKIIPVEHAYSLARTCNDARLIVVPGMGHSLSNSLIKVLESDLLAFFKHNTLVNSSFGDMY